MNPAADAADRVALILGRAIIRAEQLAAELAAAKQQLQAAAVESTGEPADQPEA